MSVLFTDSDCELWYDQLEKLNIKNIEMPYTIDNNEYFYDLGKTTDFKDFFDRLRKGSMAQTSALNSENYKDIFEPVFASGQDILYISFSHAMSGTFNQLRLAIRELKEKYPERKLTLFNTNSISYAAGLQAVESAKMKLNGASDEEIIEFLKEFTNQTCCYFIVDDLMHLKRGGRLSTMSAIAGTVLGIKPVLTFNENGALKVVNKIIGRKSAMNFLVNTVVNDAICPEKYEVVVMDADARDEAEQISKMIKEKRPELNVRNQTVGPVIGAHCGPNLLAVVYVAKQRILPIDNTENSIEVL